MKKNMKITVRPKVKKKTPLKIKQNTTDVLAKGIFKKRKWPWVISIATALALVTYVAVIAYEYIGTGSCGHCTSLRQHMTYYIPQLFGLAIAWLALSVLAFILSVFPKRSFAVTTSKILFKSGRKDMRIPFYAINSAELKRGKKLVLSVHPREEVVFKNLKNAKELYDAIAMRLNVLMFSNVISAAPVTKEPTPQVAEPLSSSKIRYFQKLYNDGVITELQLNEYITQALAADNPKT